MKLVEALAARPAADVDAARLPLASVAAEAVLIAVLVPARVLPDRCALRFGRDGVGEAGASNGLLPITDVALKFPAGYPGRGPGKDDVVMAPVGDERDMRPRSLSTSDADQNKNDGDRPHDCGEPLRGGKSLQLPKSSHARSHFR